MAAGEFAAARWGAASSAAALIEKAGVSSLESSDFGTQTPESEFFRSLVDALPFSQGAWRLVPFYRRLLSVTVRPTATWVGQSKSIRVSKPDILPTSLAPRKYGAITVNTLESFKDPACEPLIDAELRAAAVGAVVAALTDPANAGDAETPKAITHASVATNVAATAEPGDDIAAAVAAFGGDLSQAIWLLDPLSAAQLALARDAAGNFAFPAIGVRGGSILGAPAFVYRDVPRDTSGGVIALVDPSGVAYAIESVKIQRATQTTLELDDQPQGASDTPVASSATQISLFQNDLVAHKIVATANWETQRPGSVVAIVGADYATSTS